MNTLIKAIINHFYKPTFPLGVVLYLTDKCNLNCSFCDIGIANKQASGRTARELSTVQIDKILTAMKSLAVNTMYITGGEPFISKNIWYLLDRCSNNKIEVEGITTNGTVLDKLSEEQIRILNSAHVKKILISLDYADSRKHDAFRGQKGLFNKIMTFLNSSQSNSINAKYCISTVISKENYDELSSIVELCSAIKKVNHINFQPVCLDSIFVDYKPERNAKESFYVNETFLSDLEEQIGRAIKTAKSLNVSTSLPFLEIWIKSYFKYAKTDSFFFERVMKGFVCSKPYNYFHINYNGDMLACTHIGPCGNIEKNDITRLWKNNAIKYKNILNSGTYFKQCRNCFCDFGANYRYSLIYKPIKNYNHIIKLFLYYIQRYRHEKKHNLRCILTEKEHS
jgi:MoaA/NifB/PqqE/SkfB family radical SAM enzyme